MCPQSTYTPHHHTFDMFNISRSVEMWDANIEINTNGMVMKTWTSNADGGGRHVKMSHFTFILLPSGFQPFSHIIIIIMEGDGHGVAL